MTGGSSGSGDGLSSGAIVAIAVTLSVVALACAAFLYFGLMKRHFLDQSLAASSTQSGAPAFQNGASRAPPERQSGRTAYKKQAIIDMDAVLQ